METTRMLYKELSDKKNGLIELFEEEKKELVELIQSANYQKVLELSTYNTYTKVMSIVKEINEIDIKLRTLRYLLK